MLSTWEPSQILNLNARFTKEDRILKSWISGKQHFSSLLLSQKMLKKKPLIHLQWLPGTQASLTNHAAGQTVLPKAAIRCVGCFLAFWVKNRLGNGKEYSMLSEVAFWLISFWIQLSPWSLSFKPTLYIYCYNLLSPEKNNNPHLL